MTQLTITVPYNDREAVKKAFELHGNDIAAVILEPFPANAGLYFPQNDFLHFLREITLRHDSLLIFDEVMTGFRVAPGGVQQLHGITPDLTCMGKVIGGGLPVGAFGGRAEIMDCLSPIGPVYQAGTLSGNPVAMAAGPCPAPGAPGRKRLRPPGTARRTPGGRHQGSSPETRKKLHLPPRRLHVLPLLHGAGSL